MRIALTALAVVLPVSASAFTLEFDGPAIGDRPSRFEEVEIGQSTFVERPAESRASPTTQVSTFGLKNMDSQTRLQTERTLSELGARQNGKKIIVDLPGDVLFDFDKSDIRADARPVLARLADALKTMPKAAVAIIGHTDSKGDDNYNQQLSERRASSVKTWLQKVGVASVKSTEGKGESSPVAPNKNADGSDNPEGRQKNRRVEFIIEGAL